MMPRGRRFVPATLHAVAVFICQNKGYQRDFYDL
jgi:hypothetical protein